MLLYCVVNCCFSLFVCKVVFFLLLLLVAGLFGFLLKEFLCSELCGLARFPATYCNMYKYTITHRELLLNDTTHCLYAAGLGGWGVDGGSA